MTGSKREYGEGGLYWDKKRERWIVEVTLGYDGRGKRIRKRATCKTKTEALARLRQIKRQIEDGLVQARSGITVAHAIDDFLRFEIQATDKKTQDNYETLCRIHILPKLGAYKLVDLSAGDIERWLVTLAPHLSTRSIRLTLGLLSRAINRAMARDHVHRNVAQLVKQVPPGRPGRPSKSLTLDEAQAILKGMRLDPFYPYFVVSLMTGGRTEELRPLTWSHTHLSASNNSNKPPHINVWRSVRIGNDTKTQLSRRSLALPSYCVVVLREQRERVDAMRAAAGSRWHEHDLVFPSTVGTEQDASNVRRAFRAALDPIPGIDPGQWAPRELRHSFVSVLSDQGIPIEEISRLVGHSSSSVTETVYRHQLRPVIETGAQAMDQIFEDTAQGDDAADT